MVETYTAAQTVGQKIDSVSASLSTIEFSTSQLYATTIILSLTFSFYLLNSGKGSSALTTINDNKDTSPVNSLHKPKKQQLQKSSSPEPKWHILKITNYVAATGFLLSVLKFASNASTYLNDSSSLLQFLFVWSVFLCYFFGFFGISFLDLDDFAVDGQQQLGGQSMQQQQATPVRQNKADR